MPLYEEQAKQRQIASGGDKKSEESKSVVQKVAPPIEKSKARADAGKAAGVNHAYVDQAKKIQKASSEVAQQVMDGKMTLQEGLKQVAPTKLVSVVLVT